MRRRIVIFLSVVALSLLIVPAINVLSAPRLDAVKWRDRSFLYNLDSVSRAVAGALYPLGISTAPQQVIIGRDDWLYLGDQYEQTRSVGRRLQSAADLALGKQIGTAAQAWEAYLSSRGVRLFRIMVGPNKGTIYPDHLPLWARPASPNATDALFAGAGGRHVDLRPPLFAARANHQEALYYKTDTHWNFLGAGHAFQFFAQQIGPAAPEIRWPSDAAYAVSRVVARNGGDLANFLRLSETLPDAEMMIAALDLPVETTHYDFDSGQVIHQGGNPTVLSPSKPLLVRSAGALNHKKVLWLRDSFGTALSPLMAATFSDVLQLHWDQALKPGGRFVQLVEDWKPDYVFFTVVERASRAPVFAALPPPIMTPEQ